MNGRDEETEGLQAVAQLFRQAREYDERKTIALTPEPRHLVMDCPTCGCTMRAGVAIPANTRFKAVCPKCKAVWLGSWSISDFQ